MTMHLAHPALTMTGKRKGPTKWASAEQKRQHEELQQQWQQNMKQWNKMSSAPARRSTASTQVQAPRIPPGRNTTKNIPSVDSGHRGAVSSKQTMQYTGDNVLGIAIMHKSCLQPVFSQEAAVDSAHMRR